MIDSSYYKYQQPVGAIITFENLNAAKIVSDQINDKDTLDLLNHPLKMQKVQEPSDIIWENQHISYFKLFIQSIKFSLIIFVLLLTLGYIIFIAKQTGRNRQYMFPKTKAGCMDLSEEYNEYPVAFRKIALHEFRFVEPDFH